MVGAKEEAPHARRDQLLDIQRRAQQKWADHKVFESDAPQDEASSPENKFFGTFPYPYMNGLLHLGHAFSLSKLEFACAYHRLTGKRVLFPQGFHCTGMPIKACADKLDRELTLYGNPPQFPEEDPEQPLTNGGAQRESEAPVEAPQPRTFVAKKSKAAAKKGTGTTQWAILQQSGIPPEDIPQFRDSDHWLRHFPPLAMRDLTSMGCGIDWRRSFITTDRNPYYDSFVRWQFELLRRQGRVVKDKRLSIYSPKDGQPCADHDRASGEGVNPQEYTLVKMEALELPNALAALQGRGRVFLMAATLRPETMYGQTNCWVLPDGQYGAYAATEPDTVYVMSARAARNLGFQDGLAQPGEQPPLAVVSGRDLLGMPLKAPNSPHERIFVLPLLTISMGKGTGVVTSVPSDSPDDYRALQDLKEKAPLRAKFGLKDEWVLPYEVIPIVHIPGFGDKAAEKVCTDLKIASQNDAKKLAEAKNMVYLKGFTEGVMLVGPHVGKKVSEVKGAMRDELIGSSAAIRYSEPEKLVMSRSGDECVVALTDQWYLTYGEDEWLAATRQVLDRMELYNDDTRHGFEHTLGWLRQWACSRSFGLGTWLPWDPQYLIESLSDSTIYMAYYSIAHVLQRGDIYGQTPGPIAAADMTPEVWDFVYLDGPEPADGRIPSELLQTMRREFEFWYPMDLRVSGKDLIQNHLTFCLYNHAAVWAGRPDRQPRAFRTNGHLLLNAEKMSKSTGNFKTLQQAIAEYSADAMRIALADAGDAMDDANFEESVANATILRLTRELAFIDEVLAAAAAHQMRSPDKDYFVDRAFDNEMNIAVASTRRSYEGLMFREALKTGLYELQDARDRYRLACGPEGMREDLMLRYVETEIPDGYRPQVSTLLVAPVAPHWAEEVWTAKLRRPGCVITAGWPAAAEPDMVLQASSVYLEKEIIPSMRSMIQKAQAPAKGKKGASAQPPPKVQSAHVYVASEFGGWQARVLRWLAQHFDEATNSFAKEASSGVIEQVKDDPGLAGLSAKDVTKRVMPFVQFRMKEAQRAGKQVLDVKLPFDEAQLLRDNTEFLLRSLKLTALEVQPAESGLPPDSVTAPGAAERVRDAVPGSPAVLFSMLTQRDDGTTMTLLR